MNKLPEYLFAVTNRDGGMVGHIAFANGLFGSEQSATAAVLDIFASITGDDVELAKGGMPLNVRKLPIQGIINLARIVPASMSDVLVDVCYANDCCALGMGELPLASHVFDAAFKCTSCGTNFRLVWDEQRQRLVWRWRLNNGRQTAHEEDIVQLDIIVEKIKKHHADLARATETDDEDASA